MSASERARTPGEARVQEALRALPPPEARPEYRARLRGAFAAGDFERLPRVTPLPARPSRSPAWIALSAAAAAAVLLVFAANRGPRWEVIGGGSGGTVTIGVREIDLADADAITTALRPGVRVSVPPGVELVIQSAGNLALDLVPGTDMTLPAAPPRWFARASRAELRSGEIRITTGNAFHGARLAVATPEADVEVTGTTLAVIREPTGTCVCVLEGAVRMGGRREAMVPVTEGRRRYVFATAGEPPATDVMRPEERMPLTMFRAQRSRAMGR